MIRSSRKAFTLLEVVITMTLAAIAATMLFVLAGNTLWRSSDSAISLAQVYQLQTTLEKIRQDSVSNTLSTVSGRIGAEGSSATTSYGSYRVLHNRFVGFQNGGEVSGGTNLLKVTIADAAGDRLSILLAH